MAATLGDDAALGRGAVRGVVLLQCAIADSRHDLRKRACGKRPSSEGSVLVLGHAVVAERGQTAVGVDESGSLENIHLSWKGKRSLEALLGVEVVQLFGCPAPLDATVVLRVVEAGHGIEQTGIDRASSNWGEAGRAILAP